MRTINFYNCLNQDLLDSRIFRIDDGRLTINGNTFIIEQHNQRSDGG